MAALKPIAAEYLRDAHTVEPASGARFEAP